MESNISSEGDNKHSKMCEAKKTDARRSINRIINSLKKRILTIKKGGKPFKQIIFTR